MSTVNRRARVYVSAVRVECPKCEEPIPNDEGDTEWNECVGRGDEGPIECDNCGQLVTVPNIYQRFGAPLRFKGRGR